MCKYKRRLNTIAVETAGYNISTCVLALAILNGDILPFIEQYIMPHNLTRPGNTFPASFWYSGTTPLLSMKVKEVLFHWTHTDHLLRFPFGRLPRLPDVTKSSEPALKRADGIG
jgi:hypothetical protein